MKEINYETKYCKTHLLDKKANKYCNQCLTWFCIEFLSTHQHDIHFDLIRQASNLHSS